MPTTAAIYDNIRLFLVLWFLCSTAGITAGAALAFLLFHYREPRQREREGRRQALFYAAIAGLTLGVVIALFFVPPRAPARLLWLLFAVWTGGLSAVVAGIYVFKLRLLITTLEMPPRRAARAAALGLLGDLHVPKTWLASLAPAADYAEVGMEKIEEIAAKTGRRLARASTPRPRSPAGAALPPEREPVPATESAAPKQEPEPVHAQTEQAATAATPPVRRRIRRIRPR